MGATVILCVIRVNDEFIRRLFSPAIQSDATPLDIPGAPVPLSITVRQVEAFLAVCEEQHFSRAAARLCVSPPWLSQTIKELERHVGVRLLERTTRSVVLTEAGTVFASLAGRALSDLD